LSILVESVKNLWKNNLFFTLTSLFHNGGRRAAAPCDRYQTTGFYFFTLMRQSSEFDIEARQYPKRAGYNEDPATGIAACALGVYLTYYSRQKQKERWYEYLIGQDLRWEDRVLSKPLHIFLKEVYAREAFLWHEKTTCARQGNNKRGED
jgi:Phenazine biosynthesis-like protein